MQQKDEFEESRRHLALEVLVTSMRKQQAEWFEKLLKNI